MPLTVEDAERIARDCGGNPDPGNIRILLEGLTGGDRRTELEAVEFKSRFEGPKRWLQFLVEAVALANSGGGLVIFGVGDRGDRLGADPALIEELDNAKINDQLRKHSPQATLTCTAQAVEFDSKTFVVVGVAHRGEIVVFDREGKVDGGRPVFRPGVIYVRRPAQKAPATHVEVDRLIRRLAQAQASELLASVGRVVDPSSDEELVAVAADTPTEGRILTGTREGTGVRMEVMPGEDGLPVRELSDPSLPYGALETQVNGQVRLWKQSDATHRAQRQTLSDWYQRRTEFPEWSQDALEFGLRSALHVRGFPNWWASQMNLGALEQVVKELIDEDSWPTCEYLPFLCAAQFWEERDSLLRRLEQKSGGNKNVRNAIRKIRGLEFKSFRETAKTPDRAFPWRGESYRLTDVVGEREVGQAIFDEMVDRDAPSMLSANLRPIAHQLDIALHSRPG